MEFNSLFYQHLQKIFPKAQTPAQKILHKSLFYSLKGKASRFRPQLCFETTKVLGEKPKKILPWAIAIEMIHTASLIHDDMSCMDHAQTRRGKACNHIIFGEDVALLAGSCLFIESFSLLKHSVFEKKRKELLDLLVKTAGFQGLMSGQVLDLKSKKPSHKEILKMMSLKTGSLISACVLGPSLLWAKQTKQKKNLELFAKNLGLAYQLADDFKDGDACTDKKWLLKEGTDCLNKSLKALKNLDKKTDHLQKLVLTIQKKFHSS